MNPGVGRISGASGGANPTVPVSVRMAEMGRLPPGWSPPCRNAQPLVAGENSWRSRKNHGRIPNLRGIEMPDVFPGVPSRCVGVVALAVGV